MSVRPKFNPSTAKVTMRCLSFNGTKFVKGADFEPKVTKASERKMKQMYNARLLEDKQEAEEAINAPKAPELTEAQELAKAIAEQKEIDELQAKADKEAEEAKIAQAKLDEAKSKAKPKRRKRKAVKKPVAKKTTVT
jgi:hypothetical protein